MTVRRGGSGWVRILKSINLGGVARRSKSKLDVPGVTGVIAEPDNFLLQWRNVVETCRHFQGEITMSHVARLALVAVALCTVFVSVTAHARMIKRGESNPAPGYRTVTTCSQNGYHPSQTKTVCTLHKGCYKMILPARPKRTCTTRVVPVQ